jgi:sulfur-carrier protein
MTGKTTPSKGMPRVSFTTNLERHLHIAPLTVKATTVAGTLAEVFTAYPNARDYFVDELGQLRKHVAIFVDGEMVRDRARLTDAVQATSEVWIFQALSGG